MTASRSFGLNYTNTTGNPIFIAVGGATTTTAPCAVTVTLYISGVTYVTSQQYSTHPEFVVSAYAIVPPGATYKAVGGATAGVAVLGYWSELR